MKIGEIDLKLDRLFGDAEDKKVFYLVLLKTRSTTAGALQRAIYEECLGTPFEAIEDEVEYVAKLYGEKFSSLVRRSAWDIIIGEIE